MALPATDYQPVKGLQRVIGSRIGAPPIPHEHGAWVMLYLPMVVAFVAARPEGWAPVGLLSLALAGAFLARHPADLLLRGKGGSGSVFWMLVYGMSAVAAALPLIVVWHAHALLCVAAVAGVLFGLHAVLLEWPAKRRIDRSVFGEVLAVLGLTLSAPAAIAVSRGTIDALAWILWAGCALFFGSGIFHVKTLLSGAKHKGEMDPAARWVLGRSSVTYHVLLAAIALASATFVRNRPWCVVAAYTPVVVRALWGAARLSRRLPPLKRVGLMETAHALWFAVWFGAAMLSR